MMSLSTNLLILTIVAVTTNSTTLIKSDPPDPYKAALMARYVIHNADWVSISTISTLKSVKTYPFVNLKSMSDGPVSKGTGVPYLYMTELDLSGKDIEKDNRCSVLASLAESEYCRDQNYDPQDPRCARVILSGHLVQVHNTTDEYDYAKDALFSRHPAMKYWPIDHGFYIAKVDIQQVCVLDHFGGATFVSVDDYFNANGSSYSNENLIFENVQVIDILV